MSNAVTSYIIGAPARIIGFTRQEMDSLGLTMHGVGVDSKGSTDASVHVCGSSAVGGDDSANADAAYPKLVLGALLHAPPSEEIGEGEDERLIKRQNVAKV